jgi:hypothetical protein
MQSVIIIGDENLSIDRIEEIEYDGFAEINRVEEMNLLTLEFSRGRVYLDYDGKIDLDYDDEEIENIPIKNPKFIAISYSSNAVLKKLLKELYIFNS